MKIYQFTDVYLDQIHFGRGLHCPSALTVVAGTYSYGSSCSSSCCGGVRSMSSDELKVYHFTSGQLNGVTWHQVGMYRLLTYLLVSSVLTLTIVITKIIGS